ncbi:peptidase [Christiangramia fulva]|uniref:Peptidase n=1 Tax=Christiangramia fulva TaxID=2126553 RepID=A0A2R3Z3Z0_9FLAO|nr:serine hydrolase domain-containing protein [Christiangramia fulva]AVR44948.1 peptidase [Christiangramia fulva]
MKTIINSGIMLFLSISLFAQDINRKKIDSLFSIIDQNNKGMGSVSIFKNGKETYHNSIGYADYKNRKKANVETKYRIGSISKTFTAALVMQLIEEGKLQLDTKLSLFYPQIPNSDKIKIEDLLRHQSGLYNFTNSEDFEQWKGQKQSREQLLKRFTQNPIVFEPGEKTQYSNTNYVLLSFIVEDIEKTEFAEVLIKKILKPLHLENTYFGSELDPAKGEALAYQQSGDWTPVEETDMSIVLGAGGIISTPSDLNKFYTALFNGEIVKPESLSKMIKTQEDVGMGILKIPLLGRTFYGHTGGIDGFNSVVVFLPEEKTSIAFCSNARDMAPAQILEGVASIYFGEEYDLPSFESLELTTAQLKQFEGKYSAEGFPLILEIFEKDGQLMGQAEGQPSFPLEAYETNKFKFERLGLKLEFNTAENIMIFRQGKNEHELKRAL